MMIICLCYQYTAMQISNLVPKLYVAIIAQYIYTAEGIHLGSRIVITDS